MGPKCNHKCPFKGRFVIEGSVTIARYYSAGSEDGGGSQREARNAALEAGKGKETNAPPRTSGESEALPIPRFWPSETNFGFLTSRTVRK